MHSETRSTDNESLADIVREMNADSGTIHLIGADGMLHLAAVTAGFPEFLLKTISVIPVGKGMAGLAVERGKPVDACNIQTDSSGDVRPGAAATGMAGAIVVPIFRGEQVIGALGVANRGERTFDAREIEALLEAGRTIAADHPEAQAAS
jgi:signal transduction protein with GAF and PtsI domain